LQFIFFNSYSPNNAIVATLKQNY